ncbi:GNAT family N-acetyltransferase [Methanogenium organophilum]|uniref:GNAT family N-acetyltransferase n=1 Tax=Methanogenium organophilum TaxID=2199 RepID=UPI0038994EE7
MEFVPRHKQRSKYDWVNISFQNTRVGKARCLIDGDTITIYSINIFPEFQGRGYGSFVVGKLKEVYSGLTADRVRPTARSFWLKQGFVDAGDGNYVYVNKQIK